MEKINLIFFIPQFILGGEGKSITSLCKNVNKKNFKISIICMNKCYYKRGTQNQNTQYHQMHNHYVKMKWSHNYHR